MQICGNLYIVHLYTILCREDSWQCLSVHIMACCTICCLKSFVMQCKSRPFYICFLCSFTLLAALLFCNNNLKTLFFSCRKWKYIFDFFLLNSWYINMFAYLSFTLLLLLWWYSYNYTRWNWSCKRRTRRYRMLSLKLGKTWNRQSEIIHYLRMRRGVFSLNWRPFSTKRRPMRLRCS